MEDTVDKFDIRKHVHESVECVGAFWRNDQSKWEVRLKDLRTGLEYTRMANVLVSAVGAISFPRDVKFPGMENFHFSGSWGIRPEVPSNISLRTPISPSDSLKSKIRRLGRFDTRFDLGRRSTRVPNGCESHENWIKA